MELLSGGRILLMILGLMMSFIVPYLLLFVAGAITTVTQWKRIRTSAWKKVLYTLTFPLFMATYWTGSVLLRNTMTQTLTDLKNICVK